MAGSPPEGTDDGQRGPVVSPWSGGISGRQAFLAIALVFFLGVFLGIGIGLAL